MQVRMLLNLCTSDYNYAAACNKKFTSPNLIAEIGSQLNSEYNAK